MGLTILRRVSWFASCVCLVLFSLATVQAKGAQPSQESLRFLVTYRGVFSAGNTMPVADIVLRTRKPQQSSEYLETTVQASSAPYRFVESLYAMRYQFRSWYLADRSTGLAAEYYKRSDDELRHRLIYLDRKKRATTHDVAVEGLLSLPALEQGRYRIKQHLPPVVRFDRLGMLQHVRALPLAVGYKADIPVSNGRYMLRYQIQVEKREQIEIAGKTWPAFKVRFDGMRLKKLNDGSEDYVHRALYLWLSDDQQRLPLRGVARHVLGDFMFELVAQDVDDTPLVVVQTGKKAAD